MNASTINTIDYVAKKLSSSGIVVKTEFPIQDSGLRVDLLGTMPSGRQFIVEFKGRPTPEDFSTLLARAKQTIIRYQELLGPLPAFIVLSSSSEYEPGSGIFGPEEFVKYILTEFEQRESLSGSLETVRGDESKTVFVAMPFADSRFEDTYFLGIVEAAKRTGLVCQRVDKEILDDVVITEIHNRIQKSTCIVADVSNANPNVCYEIGYAKALNKPCVLISMTRPEALPFDLRSWQIVLYGPGQVNRLIEELRARFQKIGDNLR